MNPRRRQLAIGFAAVLGWPAHALSQSAARLPRVAYCYAGPTQAARSGLEAFLQGMKAHGYENGKNVLLEEHRTDRVEQLPQIIAKVIESGPSVVVVTGTQSVMAAKRASSTVPVVMATVGDPVGQGIVASLSRPGGNITGNAILSEVLSGKRLELILEIVPQATRVGLLGNPANPISQRVSKMLGAAAKSRGRELVEVGVKNEAELIEVLAQLPNRRLDAMMVGGDLLLFAQRKRIVESLFRARIPAVYSDTDAIEEGGLVGYAASNTEMWRNAAKFVHRILQGANPGDLPIEQPTRMEMLLNLRTAKALGITVPPAVLLRADRIIE